MKSRNQGFTLFELIMTLFLLGVVSGIAVPYFSMIHARHTQRIEVDALFHAVHRARKESIMKRKVISLCPSMSGEHCSAARDWSHGWILFENKDRDSPPRVDTGEPILARHQVATGVQISANRSAFTLRATFLRATNGTLVICDRQSRIAARALVISYTGRPRVANLKRDGDPYSCAH